jgi:hypothetical protein
MGVATRLAYARAHERGVATRALLRKADLTSQELADMQTRLPVRSQIEFLNLVAAALDDGMFGMNLAFDLDPRRAGLFYYVLASSDTLLQALERSARFTSIVNEGVLQKCIHGRRVGLAVTYSGVRRQDDRHQMEFWLTALVRICRQVTGKISSRCACGSLTGVRSDTPNLPASWDVKSNTTLRAMSCYSGVNPGNCRC